MSIVDLNSVSAGTTTYTNGTPPPGRNRILTIFDKIPFKLILEVGICIALYSRHPNGFKLAFVISFFIFPTHAKDILDRITRIFTLINRQSVPIRVATFSILTFFAAHDLPNSMIIATYYFATRLAIKIYDKANPSSYTITV